MRNSAYAKQHEILELIFYRINYIFVYLLKVFPGYVMENWINAEMGLWAQNFEIPEADMKIYTCSRSHRFTWQTILSDRKLQWVPTFLQENLLCKTFANSLMLFCITAEHGVLAIFSFQVTYPNTDRHKCHLLSSIWLHFKIIFF